MLKDWILRSSSRMYICKVVSIVGGLVILALAAIAKLTAVPTVMWVASPLLLFWLLDAGYAAEERRCVDLLKKNPGKEDPSALLWEGGDAALSRFFRALISLSTWPFYMVLFGLIAAGGDQITKANRQAAAELAALRPQPVTPLPSYYQPGNLPGGPMRTANGPMPFNPANPAMQRFTPSPFPTPPRFPMPYRPPVTPPKVFTPTSSPASSPAPAVKSP